MQFESQAAAALYLTRAPSALAVERFDVSRVFVPRSQDAKRRNVSIRGAIMDDAMAALYNEYYGDGAATSPGMVAEMLSANGGKGDIDMFINSPGGSSWEMAAIINSLRDQGASIYVRVYGVAASAASVIMLEGSEIEIAEYGALMLHRSWGMIVGNGKEAAEYARHLQAFDKKMFSAYSKRITDMNAEQVEAKIDDVSEWWLTSDEAVEIGLVDSVNKGSQDDDGGAEEGAQAAILHRRNEASARFLQRCQGLVR